MAGKQHSRALNYAHGTLDTAPERGEHTTLRNCKPECKEVFKSDCGSGGLLFRFAARRLW